MGRQSRSKLVSPVWGGFGAPCIHRRIPDPAKRMILPRGRPPSCISQLRSCTASFGPELVFLQRGPTSWGSKARRDSGFTVDGTWATTALTRLSKVPTYRTRPPLCEVPPHADSLWVDRRPVRKPSDAVAVVLHHLEGEDLAPRFALAFTPVTVIKCQRDESSGSEPLGEARQPHLFHAGKTVSHDDRR